MTGITVEESKVLTVNYGSDPMLLLLLFQPMAGTGANGTALTRASVAVNDHDTFKAVASEPFQAVFQKAQGFVGGGHALLDVDLGAGAHAPTSPP